MNKGLRFTLTDGSRDDYDPVNIDNGLIETESEYRFYNGYCHYAVNKSDILRLDFYDLCEECGYELHGDGCRNYSCKNNKS